MQNILRKELHWVNQRGFVIKVALDTFNVIYYNQNTCLEFSKFTKFDKKFIRIFLKKKFIKSPDRIRTHD